MKLTDVQYLQIMRYVDGEMEEEERKIFEASLEAKELLDEVEKYRQMGAFNEQVIQNVIEMDPVITEEIKAEHEGVWNRIQQARDRRKAEKTKVKEEVRSRAWIDELIEKALQSETVPEKKPLSLIRGLKSFKNREYESALEEFESVARGGSRSRGGGEDERLTLFYTHYYKGLSYMSMLKKNFEQAIFALKEAVALSPDALWKSKAQWNLALAYLKTGRKEKAEALLNEVAKNKQAEEYQQKAQDLLRGPKNKQ